MSMASKACKRARELYRGILHHMKARQWEMEHGLRSAERLARDSAG